MECLDSSIPIPKPKRQTVKPHHRDSLGICPRTIEENLTVLFGGAGED
jgi:hypothetical protein